MDFDALVEAQTGLGTAAVIVMNKQVCFLCVISTARSLRVWRIVKGCMTQNMRGFDWHLSVI